MRNVSERIRSPEGTPTFEEVHAARIFSKQQNKSRKSAAPRVVSMVCVTAAILEPRFIGLGESCAAENERKVRKETVVFAAPG